MHMYMYMCIHQVRVVQGEDDVAECYSLVVRVLDRVKGSDLRTAITAVVPKSHSMHAPVTALVEYVTAPISLTEMALQETGLKMLRRVAVENQENGRREFTSIYICTCIYIGVHIHIRMHIHNGRREFTSKHVACALGC